jgi:hypothetical protein
MPRLREPSAWGQHDHAARGEMGGDHLMYYFTGILAESGSY